MINHRLSTVYWTIITDWIVGMRMRWRMKKSLGRKVSELELVSLNTWMQVDEAEKGTMLTSRFIRNKCTTHC
jgi:hypothetical protein